MNKRGLAFLIAGLIIILASLLVNLDSSSEFLSTFAIKNSGLANCPSEQEITINQNQKKITCGITIELNSITQNYPNEALVNIKENNKNKEYTIKNEVTKIGKIKVNLLEVSSYPSVSARIRISTDSPIQTNKPKASCTQEAILQVSETNTQACKPNSNCVTTACGKKVELYKVKAAENSNPERLIAVFGINGKTYFTDQGHQQYIPEEKMYVVVNSLSLTNKAAALQISNIDKTTTGIPVLEPLTLLPCGQKVKLKRSGYQDYSIPKANNICGKKLVFNQIWKGKAEIMVGEINDNEYVGSNFYQVGQTTNTFGLKITLHKLNAETNEIEVSVNKV